MSDKNNKVKYNLKNAHYALLTVGEEGAVSYAAPVPLPDGCAEREAGFQGSSD